jgi:hypothetical protein
VFLRLAAARLDSDEHVGPMNIDELTVDPGLPPKQPVWQRLSKKDHRVDRNSFDDKGFPHYRRRRTCHGAA